MAEFGKLELINGDETCVLLDGLIQLTDYRPLVARRRKPRMGDMPIYSFVDETMRLSVYSKDEDGIKAQIKKLSDWMAQAERWYCGDKNAEVVKLCASCGGVEQIVEIMPRLDGKTPSIQYLGSPFDSNNRVCQDIQLNFTRYGTWLSPNVDEPDVIISAVDQLETITFGSDAGISSPTTLDVGNFQTVPRDACLFIVDEKEQFCVMEDFTGFKGAGTVVSDPLAVGGSYWQSGLFPPGTATVTGTCRDGVGLSCRYYSAKIFARNCGETDVLVNLFAGSVITGDGFRSRKMVVKAGTPPSFFHTQIEIPNWMVANNTTGISVEIEMLEPNGGAESFELNAVFLMATEGANNRAIQLLPQFVPDHIIDPGRCVSPCPINADVVGDKYLTTTGDSMCVYTVATPRVSVPDKTDTDWLIEDASENTPSGMSYEATRQEACLTLQ